MNNATLLLLGAAAGFRGLLAGCAGGLGGRSVPPGSLQVRIEKGRRGRLIGGPLLRCFAPYTACRFGPPLSPAQIQAVLGEQIVVQVQRIP